jgi:PIN like domain
VKVAFDENIPMALVRVFERFGEERQLKKLTGNFIIESAKKYTPDRSDEDYQPKNDVPWIKRFYQAGGRVIISGNTDMLFVPHERLALIECGMLVIFFSEKWNNWGFFDKCAHLMHWWPLIAAKARRGKKATFWCVPLNWAARSNGKLRRVSSRDPKDLKLEKQAKSKATREKKVRGAKLKRPEKAPGPREGDDLFAYASRRHNRRIK